MMVPVINFTGGEPTLIKNLAEFISYSRQKSILPGLLTNGLLINRALAESFVKNGLVTVNISIDGASAETHDAFRGVKGSFTKALSAIEIFKKLGVFTEVTTVINEFNYSELKKIVDILVCWSSVKWKFLSFFLVSKSILINS